nr:MAG TPA: hypothetical protein [Crassvirales sp.]
MSLLFNLPKNIFTLLITSLVLVDPAIRVSGYFKVLVKVIDLLR